MGFTYPVRAPEGVLSTEQIHQLLSNPDLIAKRVLQLVDQKFIADYLLPGRYEAKNGAAFYKNGQPLFADDVPREVAPGGEYPNSTLSDGDPMSARTVKWGIGSEVTDEQVTNEGIAAVNVGLQRLANSVVKQVDSVAMSVIASKLTSTFAGSAWTTPGAILESLLAAANDRSELGTGINLNTVVLAPAHFAKVQGLLLDKNALPRENGNTVLNGTAPIEVFGFTWVTTPYFKGKNPLLVDRDLLGGVADQKIKSPEFTAAGHYGVEASTIRDADRDTYKLRARRVCVPIVTDSSAGVAITGTGLN